MQYLRQNDTFEPRVSAQAKYGDRLYYMVEKDRKYEGIWTKLASINHSSHDKTRTLH